MAGGLASTGPVCLPARLFYSSCMAKYERIQTKARQTFKASIKDPGPSKKNKRKKPARRLAKSFVWSVPVQEVRRSDLLVYGKLWRVQKRELRTTAPTGVVLSLVPPVGNGSTAGQRMRSDLLSRLFEDPEGRVDVLRRSEPPDKYVPQDAQ